MREGRYGRQSDAQVRRDHLVRCPLDEEAGDTRLGVTQTCPVRATQSLAKVRCDGQLLRKPFETTTLLPALHGKVAPSRCRHEDAKAFAMVSDDAEHIGEPVRFERESRIRE